LAIQRMKSKWAKTKVLLQSITLTEFIPVTQKWGRETFRTMLDEHAMVYVKPDHGTFGFGVIRAEKLSNGGYAFQLGTRRHTFSTLEAMTERLQRIIGKRSYLIQQGIHLLRHSQRRFDIRVMVQKNSSLKWEATGIIGRLGNPAKIVTNYHSGGTPLPIEQLMETHLDPAELPAYKEKLNELGIRIARQLEKQYPGIKEIGVDVALDSDLKPWILEVNTRPDPFIFRKLPDKSVYRRIYRYCVGYGRFKRKRKTRKKKLVFKSAARKNRTAVN